MRWTLTPNRRNSTFLSHRKRRILSACKTSPSWCDSRSERTSQPLLALRIIHIALVCFSTESTSRWLLRTESRKKRRVARPNRKQKNSSRPFAWVYLYIAALACWLLNSFPDLWWYFDDFLIFDYRYNPGGAVFLYENKSVPSPRKRRKAKRVKRAKRSDIVPRVLN